MNTLTCGTWIKKPRHKEDVFALKEELDYLESRNNGTMELLIPLYEWKTSSDQLCAFISSTASLQCSGRFRFSWRNTYLASILWHYPDLKINYFVVVCFWKFCEIRFNLWFFSFLFLEFSLLEEWKEENIPLGMVFKKCRRSDVCLYISTLSYRLRPC